MFCYAATTSLTTRGQHKSDALSRVVTLFSCLTRPSAMWRRCCYIWTLATRGPQRQLLRLPLSQRSHGNQTPLTSDLGVLRACGSTVGASGWRRTDRLRSCLFLLVRTEATIVFRPLARCVERLLAEPSVALADRHLAKPSLEEACECLIPSTDRGSCVSLCLHCFSPGHSKNGRFHAQCFLSPVCGHTKTRGLCN